MEKSNINLKYSIITVVYNGEDFIEDTIKSVIAQDYPNLEYIIIDGASKDNTLKIIRKYEEHITYLLSEPDNGVFDAMNKGIKAATGKWLNFMNAGDTFVNSRVISDFSKNANDNFSLLYGYWYNAGKIKYPVSEKSMLYGGIMACHQAMFFNKSILQEELYYTLDYRLFCEYDLVARICTKGYLHAYRPVGIAKYLGGGISAQIDWHARKAKYNLVYKHYGLKGLMYSVLGKLKILAYPKSIIETQKTSDS